MIVYIYLPLFTFCVFDMVLHVPRSFIGTVCFALYLSVVGKAEGKVQNAQKDTFFHFSLLLTLQRPLILKSNLSIFKNDFL